MCKKFKNNYCIKFCLWYYIHIETKNSFQLKDTIMTTSKITPSTIANDLSVALKAYTKKVMVDRVTGAELAVNLSWDDEEFYIDFNPSIDTEYQLTFSADIDETSCGEADTIIEFKNISLKEALVDSLTLGYFEIPSEESDSLVEMVEKLIHDANFYGLEPDDYTTFTTDTDGAKSSLEDSARSNEQQTMKSLGFSNSDFL